MCVHWDLARGRCAPLNPCRRPLPAVDRVVALSDGLAVSACRIVVVDAVRVGPDAAVRP